jgi:ArsR family transcriptional regulator
VVKQLKVTLLGAAPKARTTDPEADALYLPAVQLGRQYTARRSSCPTRRGPAERARNRGVGVGVARSLTKHFLATACNGPESSIYFVFMRTSKTTKQSAGHLGALKAVASPVRLDILQYLKDPTANFPAQVDGDLVHDGVCADFIREKLGIAAATASRHLTLLTDAGLLVATRKKGWTFYRRDEKAIAQFVKLLRSEL